MYVTYVNHVNCGRRHKYDQSRRTVVLYLMLRDGTGDDGMGKHGLLGLWILASMAGSRDRFIPTPQKKARADCVKAVLWVR